MTANLSDGVGSGTELHSNNGPRRRDLAKRQPGSYATNLTTTGGNA